MLLYLADEGAFVLDGEPVDVGTTLELQLSGNRWLAGTLHRLHPLDGSIVLGIELGGPNESHAADTAELYLRIDPIEAYFRRPPREH
jgi:hypothetical protein